MSRNDGVYVGGFPTEGDAREYRVVYSGGEFERAGYFDVDAEIFDDKAAAMARAAELFETHGGAEGGIRFFEYETRAMSDETEDSELDRKLLGKLKSFVEQFDGWFDYKGQTILGRPLLFREWAALRSARTALLPELPLSATCTQKKSENASAPIEVTEYVLSSGNVKGDQTGNALYVAVPQGSDWQLVTTTTSSKDDVTTIWWTWRRTVSKPQ